MASEQAQRLKKEWLVMPTNFFEPLTFGDLESGERFIALPLPGDNGGHGGFRGSHQVFSKITTMFKEGHNAISSETQSRRKQTTSHIPDSMLVIRVLV